MTRLDFFEASFAILAVALMLVLKPILGSLIPRFDSSHNALARRYSSDACFVTHLVPNTADYEARCGANSDSKHPCFAHWSGNLLGVEAEPYLEPVNMTTNILVKDENFLDFTIKNASDAFSLTYLDGGAVQFIYSGFDAKTGCYDVTLRSGSESWRIWVSDDEGKDRDIDTKHHDETTKRLCTKWAHIHVKDDA